VGVTLLSEDGHLVDRSLKACVTAAYSAVDFSGAMDEVLFENGFE